MSRTKINVSAVIDAYRQISSAKTYVSSAKSSFTQTKNSIDSKIKNRSNIRNRLDTVQHQLSNIDSKIGRIRATVQSGANQYRSTDEKVESWKKDLRNNVGVRAVGTITSSWASYFKNNDDISEVQKKTDISEGKNKSEAKMDGETDTLSGFAKFINNKLKVNGAVLSGELSGDGEFLGVNTAGKIGGTILSGEAGIKSRMSWKFKDDDGNWDFKSWGLSTTASASGAVATGEVEGNFGYLHGEAEGKFLTGAVKGEAKCTLFDDGKFNPSLSLGASAEGSVLQGEAEVGFGTNQYGVFAKADGDFLHAEAEAKAGIGFIGTDKKGNSIYGASAEASAMASVAQGKVKGGITVFGIDIDVGVKGYAVAAGVEAGGSVSTNGVKANFSGALGLGAGLDISVDWSDAEWIGESIDAVGDFVDDAADFIGDTAKSAYDAASDFVSGAADVAGDVGDFLFGWIE